jgi:hypothetical protein
LASLAILVAEGDGSLFLVVFDEIALTDDPSVEVTRQILESGQTVAHLLALDYPSTWYPDRK